MINRLAVFLTAIIFIAMSCPFSYADQLLSKKESGSAFREALNDLDALKKDRDDAFMLAAIQPAADEQPAVSPPTEERAASGRSSTPTDKTADKTDIYEMGRRRYNIHPFISITEYYTDNLLNTSENKKSDYFTVLSPGVWIGFPWVKESITVTQTDPGSPGGLTHSRFAARYPGHLKAHVIYQAAIERYAKNSSENTTSHLLEGTLQYNFRGGLSLDVVDQFKKSYNERGTGVSSERDMFRANHFNTSLSYEVSDRVMLKLDYSNFRVHFTSEGNDFRDRSDNAVSGYVFYKVRPRLAAYGQYEYIKVGYVGDTLSNSREQHLFGGLRWDITARSRGSVKVGYGKKEFEDPEIKSNNNLLFEAQLDHMFTPKTSLQLVATRKTDESDISQANAIVSDSISAKLSKRLTSKVNAFIDFSFQNDSYQDDVFSDSETPGLRNRYYKAGLSLEYEFRERLKFHAGYMYAKRSSNYPIFDYTNNAVFFRITGSL